MSLSDPIVVMAAERIARGSKSFAGAARLFDAETRASAFMLYAWCRHCDDEIDGQVLGYARQHNRRPPRDVLVELREKTRAATVGTATEPIYIGLKRVLQKHAIPAEYPLDLIRGMEMDVEMETAGRRYRSHDDVLEYCYHVAGCVGVMMAMAMGAKDIAVLRRASDLGIAFQLTNIARDVVPDAVEGRFYLPAELMAAHGLTERDLAAPENRARVFAATRTLLDEAERYYASAQAGLPHLPFRSAWAVAAARRVYRDIGAIVRARGAAAWDTRASTSKVRKFGGVTLAVLDAARARVGPRQIGGGHASDRAGLWTPKSLL
jgi:15-cis-phytoene synthase